MAIPVDELSAGQVAELTADLRRLEVELSDVIERSVGESKPVDLGEPIGRLSRIDAISQREISAAGRRQQAQHLKEVRQALAAVAREEYGWCGSCDEPIGFKRLKARPNSTVCVACKEGRERGGGRSGLA